MHFYEASKFCFHFSVKFYPNLLSNMTVKEAIKNATEYAEDMLKQQNLKNPVKVTHKSLFKAAKNMKIFDS